MVVDKKRIGELEKILLESPKIKPRQRSALKYNLAKAKIISKQNYQDTLERYVLKYLGAIPPQGSVPGIKKEKKGCVNKALESLGTFRGLMSETTILANASIGSQGTIKGLRKKKINKGSVNYALQPQGKIKGRR